MQDGIVSNVPVGGIIQAPIGFTNEKFLPCDGRTISRASYSDLSAVIPTQTQKTRRFVYKYSDVSPEAFDFQSGNLTPAVWNRVIQVGNFIYKFRIGTSGEFLVQKEDLWGNVIKQIRARTNTSTFVVVGIAYTNGVWFILSNPANGPVAGMRTSDDFETLTAISTGSGMTTAGIVAGNGIFVALGTNTTSAKSTDGTTWTTYTTAVTIGGSPTKVGFLTSANLFFAWINGTTYYTSSDGQNWTSRTPPVSLNNIVILENTTGSVIIGWTSGGVAYYTTDGVNWVSTTLTIPADTFNFAFINGYYYVYMVGSTNNSNFLTQIKKSSNLTTWTDEVNDNTEIFDSNCLLHTFYSASATARTAGSRLINNNITLSNQRIVATQEYINIQNQILKDIDLTNNIVLPYNPNCYIKIK